MNSRMAQESLRRYVLRVLRVWRSWFIFSDDFINGLQVPLVTAMVASCCMSRYEDVLLSDYHPFNVLELPHSATACYELSNSVRLGS